MALRPGVRGSVLVATANDEAYLKTIFEKTSESTKKSWEEEERGQKIERSLSHGEKSASKSGRKKIAAPRLAEE